MGLPGFRQLFQNAPVTTDGHDLPRQELAAAAQRVLGSPLQTTTAGHVHADDGHTLDVIVRDDLCQFLGIVDAIEFWTADDRHFAFHKVFVHVRISIGRAVCRDEQFRAFEERRLRRKKFDLAWPLVQLRDRSCRRSLRGSLFRRTIELCHPGTGASAAFVLVGHFRRELFPEYLRADCSLVLRGRFPLLEGDGTRGALRETIAKAVTEVLPGQLRFAVHHFDGTFVARLCAQPTAVAILFVDADDLSDHVPSRPFV